MQRTDLLVLCDGDTVQCREGRLWLVEGEPLHGRGIPNCPTVEVKVKAIYEYGPTDDTITEDNVQDWRFVCDRHGNT